MRKLAFFALLGAISGGLEAADCKAQLEAVGLPHTLKMRSKPQRARWQPVERILTDLREDLKGSPCTVLFKDAFLAKQSDYFFPLLNNLLRTVPETSLEGAGVYAQDGSLLGEFSNRVVFEKNGNFLYYFQFRDSSGELQSSGNRLLIDIPSRKPFFQLKWSEIAERELRVPVVGDRRER